MKPTRREFIRRGVIGTAAALTGASALGETGGGVKTNRPMTVGPAAGGAMGTAAGGTIATGAATSISRVVRTSSEFVCSRQGIVASVLRDFFEEGMCALTNTSHATDAWNQLLKPHDVILVKCNQSAREKLGTTPMVVDELLRSLVTAGFSLDQIMVMEAGELPMLRKTRQPDVRWQGEVVNFGSAGSDSFIAALNEATAIINVPFIKTHPLATMTGSLKNLSHGLIRHPSKFHAHGCDPAIGQIVASQPIRTKLRLNIVNGLRVIFDRGPDATAREIHDAGTMLFSTDPVAADSVGFSLLNSVRSTRGLGPLYSDARVPKQLFTAQNLGLGESDGALIDTIMLSL